MNEPTLPPDTRREAAYSHCRALLDNIEKGKCDPLQGVTCIIQLIFYADTVEAKTGKQPDPVPQ